MQTVQPEDPQERLPPSTDGTWASARGVRKDVYALLMLVAVSIVGVRIVTAPGRFSANDASRWATIRALVETGSYSVGHREEYPDGSYKDFGVIWQGGWDTVDVVLHPTTRRFYSSKPTLLPTLLAGEYWVLRNALHVDFQRHRLAVTRAILITINLVPFVLYLLVVARLIERLGTTDWGRLFVFTTACFGTFVSGFLGSLNNHTVAAMGAMFAVYQCLCIYLDQRIVRINAVPRERVYGRSLISLRSPSPTAQISESSRRMMPDCSSVRPDKPGFKRGNVAAEAHGGRGDQKVASAAASI